MTITQDPITLNNTKSKKNNNNNIFIFTQNGMRYKFLLNSMLQLYAKEGNSMKNPYTRKPMNNKTLVRLRNATKHKTANVRKSFLNKLKQGNVTKNANNENSNFEN